MNWFGWVLIGWWFIDIGVHLACLALGTTPKITNGSLVLHILIMITFVILFLTVGVS